MSNFFDETMQGLLEAAEITKGNITLTEWENMPAPIRILLPSMFGTQYSGTLYEVRYFFTLLGVEPNNCVNERVNPS